MKQKIRKFRLAPVSLLVVLAVSLLSAASIAWRPSTALASGEAFTGGASTSGEIGSTIAIDDLQITGTDNSLLDINLYVPSGSMTMTTTTNITFSGGDTGSLLQFSGFRTDINAALATLQYTPSAVGEVSIEATIGGADGEAYNPANGHVYAAVPVGGGIDWADSKTQAEGSTYNGVSGYLVTITSDDENNFVRSRLGGSGWMGASDSDEGPFSEGDWRWIGGPENGLQFWQGGQSDTLYNGVYSNWHYPWQPDNAGDEDCGQVVIGIGEDSGKWNDLTCSNLLDYYVVEFGSDGDLPPVVNHSIPVTVTAHETTINDCEELQAINEDPTYGTNYTLANDIDCSMTNPEDESFDNGGTWSDETGFVPLGINSSFEGNFDGDGHTITGLYINRASYGRVGLFNEIAEGSTVSNLNLENVEVHGYGATGGLVGVLYGTADNCSVSGTVDGEYEVGGLVGGNNGWDTIMNSSSSATVTGNWAVGGLSGSNYGNIYSSYATGDVTGNDAVGGLVGNAYNNDNNNYLVIGGSYATGTVTGDSNVGGLVGYAYTHTIDSSYATGDVIGGRNHENYIDYVGGLIGYSEYSQVYDSHASGDVSYDSVGGVDSFGGFVGYSYETQYENDHASGNVTAGDADSVGGFVGYSEYEDYYHVYATGDVTALGFSVGGLGGYVYETYIDQSFARGDVHGGTTVGGLLGYFEYENLTDSYAMGNVHAEYEDGAGLIGELNDGNVYRTYSTGTVTGEDGVVVGGMVANGYDGGSSSFWDTQTSGQSSSELGTGKATAEMKDVATYTDLETTGLDQAWDFDGNPNDDTNDESVWFISPDFNRGYPCLAWQGEGCGLESYDDDGDTVPSDVENAAPNNGDGNNDGIADSQQANVAGVVDPVTGGYAVLAVDNECGIQSLSVAAESTNSTDDPGYEYPAGMMNFTINCGIPGFTATITQYYYDVNGEFVVRKFNGTSYAPIDGASVSDQTIDGHQVKVATYQVTDGTELDLDGQQNGIIEDPAGLAQTAATTSPDGTTTNTDPLSNTGQALTILIATAGLIVTLSAVMMAKRKNSTSTN